MNLSDIITKCYILALIIRDDGERLLLGDGIYEFKSSLQHFAPNIYQNDIVELQGTDGQLLAGQVRRSATQAFDGYIADGTIAKTTTEQSRRRFLAFFRKKHHYKVVYIMPDGTAVKRDRGYIVDAPAVQELYQLFPEYHIGLNFEDPNYYEYEEDSEGDEIYAHIQAIAITRELEAGLVWDALGAVSDNIAWNEYATKNTTDGYAQITDAIATAPLSLTHLYGNATQKTLSGKNLLNVSPDYSVTGYINLAPLFSNIEVGVDYTLSVGAIEKGGDNYPAFNFGGGGGWWASTPNGSFTFRFSEIPTSIWLYSNGPSASASTGITSVLHNVMIEKSATKTDYEEFCGGIPSPNPDYPQGIKTVTGAQAVKITGKNLCYSANRVSNTTLEFFADCATIKSPNVALSFITDFTTTGNASVYSFVDGVDLHATVGLIATTAGQRSATTLDLSAIMSQIKDGTTLRLMVYRGGSTFTSVSDAQLELGSTATAFEPYQAQSQEINLGKNLFDTDTAVTRFEAYNGNAINDWGTYSDGIVTIVKSNGAHGTCAFAGFKPKFVEGQTYTLSAKVYLEGTNASTQIRFGTVSNSNSQITIASKDTWITYTRTFTATASDVADPRIDIQAWNTGNTLKIKEIQLEAGSQATPYSAYKTPIELAKIGTYQDYIWNDDGTWKIHKETQKLKLTSTIDMSGGDLFANYTSLTYFYSKEFDPVLPTVSAPSSSSMSSFALPSTTFYKLSPASFFDGSSLFAWDTSMSVNRLRLAVPTSFVGGSSLTSAQRLTNWRTALDANDFYIVAPLDTPTDTEITDSELIEQLNHIYELYQGTNNVMLIPSAGAQGEMTVRYAIGYSDIGSGYHWNEEQGASSNIVTNDGIDSVRPLWIINGPATNPTLTNSTTGQTITWNGTVPADATLIIDMDRQTATLNGANVFAQLEGDWIELAVGPNKLQYSASGGATADSTIEWNGVIG